MKILLGGFIFSAAAIVLSTRRIGLANWELWAIVALMGCAEVLGASL